MKHRTGWSPEDNDDDQAGLHDDAGEAAAGQDDTASTVEMIRLAFAEGKTYAATEMERQRLRASLLASAGRDAAILITIALFLLGGSLVALLIGCIWALAPHLGAPGATAAVIGAALLVILLLVLVARMRVRSAIRLAFDKDEQA